MGLSLLIASASVAVLAILFKVNRWLEYRRKVNKYLDFKFYYPKPDIIGTSSGEKRRFMRISNQVTISAAIIAGALVLAWWLINNL